MLSLNGTTITSPYRVQKVLSDSESLYDIQTMKPTRADGEVVINYTRAIKTIQVTILIEATTVAQVHGYVDTLKQVADLHGEKLVVNYAGGYRAFYAHIRSFNVGLFNNNAWIPYRTVTIVYEIADPPFGLECDVNGTLTSSNALSQTGITSESFTGTATFSGTVKPKPKLKLTFSSVGDMSGFDIINRSTGQQISLTPTTPVDGDVFLIDTDALRVTRNGIDQDFSGVFPDFLLGANTVDINTYSSTGTILAASNTITTTKRSIYGTRKEAQSFTISTANPMSRASLLLSKIGSPTGTITLRVETNSGGSPSGTLVNADATVTVDNSQISTLPTWISAAIGLVPLASATTYWLVVSTTGGDVDNAWNWHMSASDVYANGSAKEYVSSWTAITGDYSFKVYTVTSDTNNTTVDFDTSTVNLNSTSQKNGSTTALWSGDGLITMNGVLTDQDQSWSVSGDAGGVDQSDFGRYIGFKFVPTYTGYVRGLVINLRKSGGGDDGSVINCSIYDGNALTNSSSSVPGAIIEGTSSHITMAALSTSYTNQTFNFNNVAVTAGHPYFVFFSVPDAFSSSMLMQGDLAEGGAWSSPSQLNGAAYSETHGIARAFTSGHAGVTVLMKYRSYAAVEYGITNELDSTDADIIAASQYVTTILTNSSTFQGAYSPDNGSTWNDMVRDASLMLTDTIPSTTGTQLKWRAALQNTTTPTTPPYVTGVQVGWRKGGIINATTRYQAQGFQVLNTANRQRLDLYLAKLGSPGDITVRIETDSAGSPSGTLVNANATKTLAHSAVTTAFGWVSFNFPGAFSLTAATTYWIVVKAAATVNDSNKYLIMANNNRHTGGSMKKSTNSGSSYSAISSAEDLMFRTYATTGNAFRFDLSTLYTKRYE